MIDLCFSRSALSTSSSPHTVTDCLAVGQAVDGGSDERVVLFVKLLEGENLSTNMEQKIKAEVRLRRSPRHVPARVSPATRVAPKCCLCLTAQIVQVTDIPYTLNGKRLEVPVKKVNIYA